MDLHEIFREGWHWASEQMIKFCWRSGSRIRITADPYHDTGETCLGGGMHCSRFLPAACWLVGWSL